MTGSWSRSDALSELDTAARRRVRLGALIAALVTAMAVASPILLPPLAAALNPDAPRGRAEFGLSLSQPMFDVFQRHSPGDVSDRVQVVEIDEQSLARYGGWPWSRFDLTNLVQLIAEQKPAAIGFDLLFPEPDRLTPEVIEEYYPDLSAGARAEIRTLAVPDARFGNVIGLMTSVTATAHIRRAATKQRAGCCISSRHPIWRTDARRVELQHRRGHDDAGEP